MFNYPSRSHYNNAVNRFKATIVMRSHEQTIRCNQAPGEVWSVGLFMFSKCINMYVMIATQPIHNRILPLTLQLGHYEISLRCHVQSPPPHLLTNRGPGNWARIIVAIRSIIQVISYLDFTSSEQTSCTLSKSTRPTTNRKRQTLVLTCLNITLPQEYCCGTKGLNMILKP